MGVIKDGKTGNVAEVTAANKLATDSISLSHSKYAAREGRSFIVITPIETLTTDSSTAFVHLKNTGTVDLVLESVRFHFAASTGGTGPWKSSTVINATAGTILTNSQQTAYNRNFGKQSANPLEADVLFGTEGDTASGAIPAIPTQWIEKGIVDATLGFVLPKGVSLTLLITPPTGNTSADVNVSLTMHVESGAE